MTPQPQVAISVNQLSKAFRIYERPSHVLKEIVTRKKRHRERWALDDVSFEVKRGEVVGVLGRNGAGKSTLLKILAGTLDHTSGNFDIRGRITAILELGTGFHPDYTGRENIFMGGMCLGMNREEVEGKIAGIIEFSELEEFIDDPFKTYSTGMRSRLTFATAISVDPDILIVDEALSVGDAKFQMKCFERISRLRREGKTILLVSHDINTITTFCDRAFILENGRVYAEGLAKEMAETYHHLLFGKGKQLGNLLDQESFDTGNNENAKRYGNGDVVVKDFGIINESGTATTILRSGDPYRLRMTFEIVNDIKSVSGGFAIKDKKGTTIYGVTNLSQNEQVDVEAGETLQLQADLVMWLAAGDYFLTLGIADPISGEKFDFIEDAIHFTVLGPSGIFTTSMVNLQTKFSVVRKPPEKI